MANSQTSKHATPAAAVDRLEELYAGAASALAGALDRYLNTRAAPSRETRSKFNYPVLRLVYRQEKPQRTPTMRAFGKLQHLGGYETTVTHPGDFRGYLLEQLGPLVA